MWTNIEYEDLISRFGREYCEGCNCSVTNQPCNTKPGPMP